MGKNKSRIKQQPKDVKQEQEITEKNTTESVDTETNATKQDTENKTTNEQKVEKTSNRNIKNIKTLNDLFETYKQDPKLKDFVILINIFYNKLKGPEKDNPEIIVAAQYSFFNGILKHLNTNNYNEFKAKFDLLLKAFVLGKNTPFNIINIVKFDHFWKYSVKSRIDFYMFMTFLDAIANPKNRRTELKRLKLEKLSSHIPENIYKHITRYLNK